MKRHVVYEAAFRDLLITRGIPCVAVDEAKRAAFRDVRLKSFDFVVYSQGTCNWLVDIKGRRWAPRRGKGRPAWENWVTEADIEGLSAWQEVFGDGFRGLIVFAYRIDADAAPPAEFSHAFRDASYVFAGVPLDLYREHARLRSPKWATVNVPLASFARIIQPIENWL